MHSITILCAFVMKARAQRRHCGESWRQTRREQKEDRKREKREWEGSKERPLMSPIFDDRHREYEDYCERKMSRAGKRPHPGVLTSQIKESCTI